MHILFVCTGNTCRSAMAAAYAAQYCAERELSHDIKSAGVFAQRGTPASTHARTLLPSLDTHAATPLDAELLKWTDVVYGMTQSHVHAVLSMDVSVNVHLLGKDGKDITDPFGGTLDDYTRCLAQIRKWVKQLIQMELK